MLDSGDAARLGGPSDLSRNQFKNLLKCKLMQIANLTLAICIFNFHFAICNSLFRQISTILAPFSQKYLPMSISTCEGLQVGKEGLPPLPSLSHRLPMSISTSDGLQVRKEGLSPLPSLSHRLPMSIPTSEGLQVRKRDLSPLLRLIQTKGHDPNSNSLQFGKGTWPHKR